MVGGFQHAAVADHLSSLGGKGLSVESVDITQEFGPNFATARQPLVREHFQAGAGPHTAVVVPRPHALNPTNRTRRTKPQVNMAEPVRPDGRVL
ncbi:hypothetical protein [Lentzea flava]|uniref:Uncharacterized protein n=1 Tax=Lentzea flava TaxID=103732 RepID=A0ABQ2VF68_9PSEU|nr:hypothetical protein [Lentzea flava]MCP2204651.1 hypothetical protein [Lentzea flava]GGU80196.1 hypothetical protein GCM10010178_83770 [Lentzea flava]